MLPFISGYAVSCGEVNGGAGHHARFVLAEAPRIISIIIVIRPRFDERSSQDQDPIRKTQAYSSILNPLVRTIILASRFNFLLCLSRLSAGYYRYMSIIWDLVCHAALGTVSSVKFLNYREKTSIKFLRPNFLRAGAFYLPHSL